MRKASIYAVVIASMWPMSANASACPPLSNPNNIIPAGNCVNADWMAGNLTLESGASISTDGQFEAIRVLNSPVGTFQNNGGTILAPRFGLEIGNSFVESLSNSGSILVDDSLYPSAPILSSGIVTFQSAIGSITNQARSEIKNSTSSSINLPVSTGITNIASQIHNIRNDGLIETENADVMSSILSFGVSNTHFIFLPSPQDSSIGEIINNGTIFAHNGQITGAIGNGYIPSIYGLTGDAIYKNTIQSILNRGDLLASEGGFLVAGIFNGGISPVDAPYVDRSFNKISVINNHSAIKGESSTAFYTAGIWNGTINLSGSGGISNREGYVIDLLSNHAGGTISSFSSANIGLGIFNSGVVGDLQNNGRIFSLTDTGFSIGILNFGRIENINNLELGEIDHGIFNFWDGVTSASIGNLNNAGVIRNTGTNFTLDLPRSSFAILNSTGSTIDNLTNLSGGRIVNGLGNSSGSTIHSISNFGTIEPAEGGFGIMNRGSIGTLTNGQGDSPLTYSGPLPANYYIVIYGPGRFGKLDIDAPGSSIMRFDIFSGSTVANGTYGAVLSGLSRDNLLATSGTFGSGFWSLVNRSPNIWDLILTGFSPTMTDINAGESLPLSQVGITVNPVFNGGTLTTANGNNSSINFTVNAEGGTITSPTSGSATLSGVFSGSGGLNFNGSGTTILTGANTYSGGTTVTSGTLQGNTTSLQGAILNNSQVVFDQAADGTYSGVMSGSGSLTKQNAGTLILTGANTYSGGTTISSGTLSVAGTSPTGTGPVTVASGATLMGRGTITGSVNVFGILKPGNSPGYLSTTSSVTMNTGSSYLQDIAGTVQASGSSPVGATGYYSFLNVTNGQFVIQPGATLTPRLSNLFTVDQSGYGSAIFVPRLGNRMRIVTAAGGISGRFSTVTQPAELAAGTQFLPFYNMAGSNSIDLAVIPTSYQSTIAAASGNTNAKSVGGALTKIAQAGLAGTSTAAQDQLLYAISGQSSAQSIANLAQGMSGEVYAATVAVMAQTTQRTQQAVLNRLGETAGLNINMPMATATSATTLGGVPGAGVSSNPNVNPTAEAKAFSNGNIWGDLAYQRGDRSSDSHSGGWNSNLYQLTFGSDFYSSNGTTMGAGFSLSNTTLNPVYGSSTIQQGSLFAYGKMPVESFVVDAMASAGLSYSNISRGDVTGLSSKFKNNSVSGSDVMVSLGLSRPFDTESIRLTPFARVSWQMVTQSSVNEGDAASALSVNRYTGNGVRAVIGLAAGSKADNPMTSNNTYRAYVGVGVDSSALLNPTLNASIVGVNTNITTPNAGTTFVQAGLYGTAKLSDNSFAYAGIAGEARSGQTLGSINVGVKLQF